MRHLGRLLLAGYGLAAVGGAAAHQAGFGLMPVVLIFWLGGAVAVAALAVALAPRLETRPATSVDEDAMLAEALRLWEEDRLGDRLAAADGRREDKAAG